MKYFIDTEFLEGTQKTMFSTSKPTIDLISIGMVDENGREFYAISNEFNLKEAWNRWEKVECCNIPQMCGSKIEGSCEGFKRKYWIRENVLLPIYYELLQKERYAREYHPRLVEPFSYKTMKTLIKWHGRSKNEIANGICAFIYGDDCGGSGMSAIEMAMRYEISDKTKEPDFYGYNSAYDWVVFCWLFGKMITLPKGFPKYCRDLKQVLHELAEQKDWYYGRDIWSNTRKDGDTALQEKDRPATLEEKLMKIKQHEDYPKQTNQHNALADAKWNKELFVFLKSNNHGN